MNNARTKKAITIFQSVVELSAADRADALERLCGSDIDLRSEVEALLSHDQPDWDTLDQPFLGEGTLRNFTQFSTTSEQLPSESVGPYRVLELVGRGSMGAVYRAQQSLPEREVAIKVIHADRASGDTLRRFLREGRLLGRLHHANIAQIFEAGNDHSTGMPRPYLVMEFVAGTPLNVVNEGLSLNDRIAMMIKVCSAMDYAHRQGVVHRDLKPENILVEAGPSGLVPKVVDFGIGRLIEHQTRDTFATEAGKLLGTLAYMSPEQVRGESGVSVDVYALGVLLYEVLTRSLPIETNGREFSQIISDIESGTALRPSHRNPSLSRDLDTIVLKAMEKDVSRRYASAAALAEDLRRYLDHQPILAREPSLLYVVGKFAKRRRATFLAACVALMAIVVGSAMGWYGLRRARASLDQLADVSGFFAADIARQLDTISGTFEVRKELLSQVQTQLDMLMEHDPNDVQLWKTYANVLQYLGNIDRDEGRESDALIRRHQALAWRERILERTPDDIGSQAKLSIDHVLIGDLHRHEPGLATTRTWYESALEIQKKMVANHPERIDWLDDLGWSYERLAFLAVQTFRFDDAETLIQLRLDICSQLSDAEPDAPRTLFAWRSGHWIMGDLRANQQEVVEAYACYQRSFDFAERLYQADPNNRVAAEYCFGAALKLACPPDEVDPSRPLTDYLQIAERIAQGVERLEPTSELPGRMRREVEFKRYLVARRMNDLPTCHKAVEEQLRLVRHYYQEMPTQDAATAYEAALTYGTELAQVEHDVAAIEAYEAERYELFAKRVANPKASPRDKARYACILGRRDSSEKSRDEVRRWAHEAVEEIGESDPSVLYSAACAFETIGDHIEARQLFETVQTATPEQSYWGALVLKKLHELRRTEHSTNAQRSE